MLLNFKPRFVPMILDGSKQHTIRAKRKLRPKVGELCHCYTGLRHKGAKLLGRWKCVRVETIVICEHFKRLRVRIDGRELDAGECNALAWADGFRTNQDGHPIQAGDSFAEMTRFWLAEHGKKGGSLIFMGDIIYWRYEQPNKAMRGAA